MFSVLILSVARAFMGHLCRRWGPQHTPHSYTAFGRRNPHFLSNHRL